VKYTGDYSEAFRHMVTMQITDVQ